MIYKTIKSLEDMTEIYCFNNLRNDIYSSRIIKSYDLQHLNQTVYTNIKGVKPFVPNRNRIREFKKINSIDIDIYDDFKSREYA